MSDITIIELDHPWANCAICGKETPIGYSVPMYGWTEGISDTRRYKCLGNAVTVNVIEAIAGQIYKYNGVHD